MSSLSSKDNPSPSLRCGTLLLRALAVLLLRSSFTRCPNGRRSRNWVNRLAPSAFSFFGALSLPGLAPASAPCERPKAEPDPPTLLKLPVLDLPPSAAFAAGLFSSFLPNPKPPKRPPSLGAPSFLSCLGLSPSFLPPKARPPMPGKRAPPPPSLALSLFWGALSSAPLLPPNRPNTPPPVFSPSFLSPFGLSAGLSPSFLLPKPSPPKRPPPSLDASCLGALSFLGASSFLPPKPPNEDFFSSVGLLSGLAGALSLSAPKERVPLNLLDTSPNLLSDAPDDPDEPPVPLPKRLDPLPDELLPDESAP